MINPSEINLSSLPWLPLDAKSAFPKNPAIYFAIDSQGTVQYIGRSLNPKARWAKHHRYKQLEAIGSVRIVYLFVDSPELLSEIESALISWFDPPLNVGGKSTNGLNQEKSSGVIRNRIKLMVDQAGITRYQFWKETGLAQNTAYRLYDDPTYIPGEPVMEKICSRYGWQPGDYIIYIPNERLPDNEDGDTSIYVDKQPSAPRTASSQSKYKTSNIIYLPLSKQMA